MLLGAAALMFTGADTVYLFQVANETYVQGGALDVLWPVSLTLILAAAWQPIAPARRPRLAAQDESTSSAVSDVTSMSITPTSSADRSSDSSSPSSNRPS